MKRTKEFQNDAKDPAIQEIKAAMKRNKDLRMHERYQTLLMLLHGYSHEQISKATGRSLATTYNYAKAYREGGIAGLEIGHSPGRPRQLTSEQEEMVYQTVINQKPADVGFPAKMNWTAPMIGKWIEQQFGVVYSERGTRELLYRLQLSFTTPTYTLAKADPIKQEAFKQELEEIKKTPE